MSGKTCYPNAPSLCFSARRVMRFDRKDKRFQLFSDEPMVDPDYYQTTFSDLLGKIKRIVREAHEGLISAAEVFYKQKVDIAILILLRYLCMMVLW